jgi:hypothetical protein
MASSSVLLFEKAKIVTWPRSALPSGHANFDARGGDGGAGADQVEQD